MESAALLKIETPRDFNTEDSEDGEVTEKRLIPRVRSSKFPPARLKIGS
jgi:hypothetical protein